MVSTSSTTSSMRPIPKCATSRPPLQRSASIDSHKPLARLSHGCQLDLQQAVQLEKQELGKLGLLPPSTAEMPLPKLLTPEAQGQQEDETPPYWLYRQQRQVRRAASFTSGQQPATPCSPPVPIPQHHEAQRRYSAGGEHPTHDQCESRLWDEFWNYKLSFESRESFEAANLSVREGTRTRASSDHLLLTFRSEASMTSTADTVTEDEDGGPEEDGRVFEMDDL